VRVGVPPAARRCKCDRNQPNKQRHRWGRHAQLEACVRPRPRFVVGENKRLGGGHPVQRWVAHLSWPRKRKSSSVTLPGQRRVLPSTCKPKCVHFIRFASKNMLQVSGQQRVFSGVSSSCRFQFGHLNLMREIRWLLDQSRVNWWGKQGLLQTKTK
jgi:hypothetical protein